MRAILAALALVLPVQAGAQDISFSPAATLACLLDAEGVARLECVGASASQCMDSPGGSSTVGMGYCLNRELGFWDDRLNAAYGDLRAVERGIAVEMTDIAARVPDTVGALRDMQRAWIGYRDAACIYEYSTWGGGTGGGPAHAACLMDLTARQTLMLEDRLKARMR